MKKIIGILVCMLLITTAILTVIASGAIHKIKASNYELNTEVRKPIIFTNYENGDVLDQNQSDYCGWGWVVWGPDFRLAQSFKPTLNMISRVELLLYLIGTPGKLEISIRSELSGPDLTSIIVDGTNISGSQEHWAEFDFPAIGLEPEQTYYIIWSTIDTDSTNYFVWGYGDYNPYDRGDAYTYSPAHGWRINEGTPDHPDIDFCFKTYGRDNLAPGTPTIKGKTRGAAGVEYCWKFSSVDSDGDDVMYIIDWDDGETTETECYPSGMEVEVCHTYAEPGTYVIRVKAKDCPYGLVGPEATLRVTMPRNKIATYNSLFIRFLEQFPILQKILLLLQR